MFHKTLILSALLAAVAPVDAPASRSEQAATAELEAQRESLLKRLDAVKTRLAREPHVQEARKLAQWPNWSDFQNSWGNFGNW